MSQVTTIPINLASVKDLENPTLVGQGSFGKVYLDSKTNKVYKKSDTIIYKDNDYIIIENNIRELVFYTYIKEKFGTSANYNQSLSYFLDSVEHISIPYKLEVSNNISKIYLEHNGIPLSKYKYESLNELKLIFSQICSTVYSFYSKGMTHGDIKPSNILIKKEKIPYVKLIDFGSVQFNHLYKIKQKHQRCSLLYVSPEELEEYIYSLYNDWWGVGMSMFEIITGKTFIECLLNEYNVDGGQIRQFFECVYKLKRINNFNPVNFLKSLYREIKQCHITKTINDNIKDEELRILLLKFLIKNPLERKNTVEHALKYLYMQIKKSSYSKEYSHVLGLSKIFETKEKELRGEAERLISDKGTPIDINNQKLIEYRINSFECYSFDKRKCILDIIYRICIDTKYQFGYELYGHTVMLLDRVYVNWNKYLLHTNQQDDLDGVLIGIICLIVSRCLFKSSINKIREIIELYDNYYPNLKEDSIKKYKVEEVLDLFNFVLHMLNFELYNISPDILLKIRECDIDIRKMNDSFIKYLIVNETTEKVFNLFISV